MHIETSERGFHVVNHPVYLPPDEEARLVQESSAIGEYDDSFEKPGSSFLWIGDKHHLNREEVAELVVYLTRWTAFGSLEEPQ